MNLRNYFYTLCAAILLLMPLGTKAGTYTLADRLQGSSVASGYSLTVQDGFWQSEEKNNQSLYRSHRLSRVSLIWGREDGTDIDVQAGTTSGTIKVNYTIDFVKDGTYLYSKTDDLIVTASSSDPVYSAIKLYDANADKIVIKINTASGTGDFSSALPTDLRFEGAVEAEVYRYLNPTAQTTIDYDATDKVLGWNYRPGAEEYEVEWAWIDDESNWPQSRIFETASRIRTSCQWYAPDLTYRPGVVYFRVRPVGRFIHDVGTDYSIKKYGAWSATDSLVINSGSGMEKAKNWQYSMTFSEEGVYKKVLSYFDGSMRPRQALTNLSTDGNTVIAQSEYDLEGRGVIQTLPFPDSGLDLSWRADVNRKTSSAPWLPTTTDTIGGPVAMSTADGANKYYSSNNGFSGILRDYIPNAGGYAYTQVEFLRDASGRVKSQGGVGPDHTLGSGHEVKYFYGNCTPEELVRLFGSNVGAAGHYSKMLQVDPNGQVSVTWSSMGGQTIATALAGESPENVLALDEVDTSKITVNLMGNNVVDQDARTSISTSELMNSVAPNRYAFHFDMRGVVNYAGLPFDICEDCEYELSIWIRDPDGDLVQLPDSGSQVDTIFRTINLAGTQSCTQTLPYTGPILDFAVDFDKIGDYTVVKQVRALPITYEATFDMLVGTNGFPSLADTITYYENLIDSSICDVTCLENATSYLRDSLNREPTQLEINDFAAIHCAGDPLDSLMMDALRNECTSIYEAMLSDFRPGGWLYVDSIWAAVVGDSTLEDSLVQTHREYCHYTQCLLSRESSLYDLQMAGPATHTIANTDGYTTPLSGSGADPWFATGGQGASMSGWMSNWLTKYSDTLAYGTSGITWNNFYGTNATDPAGANNLNLYASCNGSSGCEDSLRWQIQRGVYLDQKTRMQVLYVEDTLGCPYFEDDHVIVQRPGMPENPSIADFTTAQMSDWCNGRCQGNVNSWMQYLVDSCGVTAGDTAVENTLMRYCLDHCGMSNPLGLILESDSANGDLAALITTLTTYGGCADELDSLVQPSPYQYDIDSTSGDTTFVPCDRFDPCLTEAIAVVNAAFTTAGMPDSIYFGDNSLLMGCFGPDSIFTFSGNELIIGAKPNHCVVLNFGLSGTPTLEDSIRSIRNLRFDSGGTLQADLYFAPTDSTQSTAVASLTVPTLNGCLQFVNIEDSCPAITGITLPELDLPTYTRDSCLEELRRQAAIRAEEAWERAGENYVNSWLAGYAAQCLADPFEENFRVYYKPMEYHYTLYYYDQAGNLVQTVPPEGVEPLDSTDFTAILSGQGTPANEPAHRLETGYQHNSVEQVTRAETPDGGVSEFYYNDKHQLRFSQDARQAANGWLSYTQYDHLGRVTEVGRVDDYVGQITETILGDMTFPDRSVYQLKDITRTVWDQDVLYGGTWQENLRMRIAAVFRETDEGDYTARHFYSYDDHGNVDHYRVQLPDFGIKRMDYTYDLVSGNVLQVDYQYGEADYWAHRYRYDADNRIRETWTSRNGVVWDRDARYAFYAHGPMARTEIGEDGVQGCDHFYSIHGWIKGVNVAGGNDPGEDGRVPGSSLNKWMGRDELAYGLAYYDGDYDPIGNVTTGALDNAWTKTTGNGDVLEASTNGWDAGLFNGNIPWMVTDLNRNSQVAAVDFAVSGLQGMAYQYDQLHRIKQAKSYRGYASNWASATTGLYETNYSYDANGNLESLNRWAAKDTIGGPLRRKMDELTYKYNLTSGEKDNNRLRQVDDAMGVIIPGNPPSGPITWFDNDYDYNDPGGNDAYRYDEIGNLIEDDEGNIDTIRWDNYGKIEAVERDPVISNAGANLYFEYDGTGNRISKRVVDNPYSSPEEKTTYYIRDPQGNVMAVYNVYDDEEDSTVTELKELTIYGSDRLGVCQADTILQKMSVDAGAVSVGHKGVIFVETMYDSPLSPATVGQKGGPAETHRGEYLVLWNTTADSVPLEDYSLKNLSNSDTVDFSGDTLAPFQWMLVGHADSVADLQLVTALPWSVLNDSAVTIKLVDDFRMEDTKGQLRLKYMATGELIDAADYGSVSGWKASNAFVSEEDLDSLGGRDALKGIIRIGLNKPGYGFDPSNFDTKDIEVKVEPVFEQDWFTNAFDREPGCKRYELKNHLGNVLTVVSDWKIGRDTVGNGAADYYLADIRSLSDYYPFGMEMAARSWNADGYRYGFQGQETDDEWQENNYQTTFRQYDARIGRWNSIDPKTYKFPFASPYNYALNKPILGADGGGDEFTLYYSINRIITNGFGVVVAVLTDEQVESIKTKFEELVHFFGEGTFKAQYVENHNLREMHKNHKILARTTDEIGMIGGWFTLGLEYDYVWSDGDPYTPPAGNTPGDWYPGAFIFTSELEALPNIADVLAYRLAHEFGHRLSDLASKAFMRFDRHQRARFWKNYNKLSGESHLPIEGTPPYNFFAGDHDEYGIMHSGRPPLNGNWKDWPQKQWLSVEKTRYNTIKAVYQTIGGSAHDRIKPKEGWNSYNKRVKNKRIKLENTKIGSKYEKR